MELTSSEPAPVKTAPETPSKEAPKEETPASPEPAKAEEQLFETPDGRKVDAKTLEKEWKENFLPEFTRKSQALAEIERKKEKINSPENDEPNWKSPDYVPKDYAEVIQLAKEEAIREITDTYQEEQNRIASIKASVENEVADLKKIDPKLDENALFTHANKYGFQDLKTAYSNMTDMKKAVIDTEQKTVKNLKNRESDPVSSGAAGHSPEEGYDPNAMSQFRSATEYYARIKGTK